MFGGLWQTCSNFLWGGGGQGVTERDYVYVRETEGRGYVTVMFCQNTKL